MESLLGVFYVLLVIGVIVDVLRGYLPMAKKILWSVLIFILPLIGMILYFLLGRQDHPQGT
ncbi:MAG TPA: hypothetical protein DD723_01250 [Candidatus Omnitrophica bacterium]|nr:MAG: hypothetical protein A2Z81_02175 [Omnitrophica WOR_2 bacterium GWA2_45_18]HBR14157.1 hypothetical protein [Candidatus Omnitrophota bacterium]